MKNYCITEEEYFEYYQNSNDPTFELYQFDEIPEKEFPTFTDDEIDSDLPF